MTSRTPNLCEQSSAAGKPVYLTPVLSNETAPTANETPRKITWTHYYAKEDVFSRIDYILLSHAMEKYWTKSETYILSSPDWGLASDHRPLVAAFTIPDN